MIPCERIEDLRFAVVIVVYEGSVATELVWIDLCPVLHIAILILKVVTNEKGEAVGDVLTIIC